MPRLSNNAIHVSAADFVNTLPPSSVHRSDRYCFPISRAAIYQGFDRLHAAITGRRARLEALAPIHSPPPQPPTTHTHTATAAKLCSPRRWTGLLSCTAVRAAQGTAPHRAWRHNNNSFHRVSPAVRAPVSLRQSVDKKWRNFLVKEKVPV